MKPQLRLEVSAEQVYAVNSTCINTMAVHQEVTMLTMLLQLATYQFCLVAYLTWLLSFCTLGFGCTFVADRYCSVRM